MLGRNIKTWLPQFTLKSANTWQVRLKDAISQDKTLTVNVHESQLQVGDAVVIKISNSPYDEKLLTITAKIGSVMTTVRRGESN